MKRHLGFAACLLALGVAPALAQDLSRELVGSPEVTLDSGWSDDNMDTISEELSRAVFYSNSGDLTDPYKITRPANQCAANRKATDLQTALGLNSYGFGCQDSAGIAVADDFILCQDYQINQIVLYIYQTGATAPSVTTVKYAILDSDPTGGPQPTWTTVTPTKVFENVHRKLDTDTDPNGCTRRLQKVTITVSPAITKTAGRHWLAWRVAGSAAYSGPWQMPVTIPGATGKATGNALQNDPNAGGLFTPLLDGVYPQDLVFVLGGTAVGNPPTLGACCLWDGTCVPDTCSLQCTSDLGGTWQGAGISCTPNPCVPPVYGACCFPGGLCLQKTQAQCEAMSGGYYGDDVPCVPNVCPTPTDCGDATLMSQPVVDPTGTWTFYASDSDTTNTTIDDYAAAAPICDLQWWGIDAFNDGTSWYECDQVCPRFEIKFYPDDGTGKPDVANPACTYVLGAITEDTGISYSGFELKHYSVGLNPCCTLLAGWVSIRGVTGEGCWFMWGNGLNGDLLAYQLQGTSLVGVADDLAFCLTGDYVPALGACCLGTACTPNLTQFQCLNLCGEWYPDAPCNPNPCLFGACCLMSGMCLQTSPPACDALAGIFIGDGVACAPNPCPMPEDCGPATLFSQVVVPPDGNWNFVASDSSLPYISYDNYQAHQPICDLQWWGLDLIWNAGWGECDQVCPRFEIKFYPDNGTGKPNVNAPTCTYVLGALVEDTGILYGDVFNLKHYSVGLNPCCTLLAGWVSIRGIDGDTCAFLWGNATGGDAYGYQFDGNTLVFQAIDMAFCLTGDYQGPTGACCVGEVCTPSLTEYQCLNLCGVWHPGVGCTPTNPCVSNPTGACCLDYAGVCQVLTQANCVTAGGRFKGVGTTCADPAICGCKGDCNCDGVVDFSDINPFVEALSGGTPCSLYNCDIDDNGTVDFNDINEFVQILSAGAVCP